MLQRPVPRWPRTVTWHANTPRNCAGWRPVAHRASLCRWSAARPGRTGA